jgi:phosphotransferase system HPr-like phosphotransfer protein
LDEEDEEDSENDLEEEDEEPEEVTAAEVSDDTEVEIAIDGEVKTASIKDLKRLYGQEASLTRKSQEAASQRKLADDQLQKADASLQAMLSRAQERYKPYSEVDMLVASKQMDAESFTALRAEAKQAEDDLKFLSEEADQFYSFVKQQQAEAKQAEAKECIKVLQKEIPDWNNDLYNDIRSYAIGQGLPEEAVNQYSDPNVIMLLNKARMFDQTKKVATAKKAKASKKILRSKKAPPTKADIKAQRQKKTMDKLRSGGNDLDNIADAIMAGWE